MATPTSFKQQCPSCEAMVPIRDPKLIGRKIDCPKCKYRFIVEEPADEVEEAEEAAAAPAKKGKAGSASITAKKPASKVAAPRRADDDQDIDDSQPKKKQGGSGMLVVGIALAAVAVIALAVGAVFLFSSDDSDDKPARATPVASAPANDEKKTDGPKEPPKEAGPRPRQDDISNLLPNDTQFVFNLPLEHLLGNPKVNQALLKTPGGFHEGAFQHVWGITPGEIRRVVLGANGEKKTTFSVMRTSAQIKEKQIVETLKLKPEAPVNGLRYYLVKKPLDALSTILLQGPFHHDKVALHFMDPFTVVCADPEPMNQFLQDKGQPKQLSRKPDEEEQEGGGGGQGGMPGGPPGMPGGPPGMPGGPPGGGKGPGSQGGPGAGAGVAPIGAGPPGGMGSGTSRRPGGAGGGFQPPQGMAPGMMPPGMGGSGGSASAGNSAAAPFSSSYMTVDPHLKAALDQAEKVDKTENQNVLLSAAMSTSAVSVEHVKKFMDFARTQAESEKGVSVPQIPEPVLKVGLDNMKGQLKAVAVAVTDFSESKLSGNLALAAKDAKLAQEWEKQTNEGISTILSATGLDFVARNSGSDNNRMGMSGMPGMPAMPGMPNMPNMPGGSMPAMPGGMQGMRPPGGMQGMRPPGGMQPPGMPGGMRPPGGMQPPGFPGGRQGMQPQGNGEENTEGKGKMGEYAVWTKENVLALGITGNINSDVYKGVGEAMEKSAIVLRGEAAMSDRRLHIHELAAATQAYLEEKGQFPQGAVSRAPDVQRHLDWRPDQRLSWMTELLPYLANGEFKELQSNLNKDKSWYEDANNVKAGMTVVPQFVAPDKLGNSSFYVPYPNLPVKSPDMWAATHFVGIAGVGLDAAEYRADDAAKAKLLGVFGYDRVTKKADIKDGLAQTIVLIQVPPEPKSPWIAGGGSTVRGLSEDLDCVQPFVCTEYEGKRGTFAIMADGKVRFIPASIDPKTFRAMCTIAGDDKITNLEKVAPEVSPPEEQPQAELKTEQPAPAVKPPAQSAAPASGAKPDARDARLRSNQLKRIGLAYHNYVGTSNKPPAKVEELAPFYENDAKITAAIKDGTFIVFWNSSFQAMKAGTSNTILAYEKETPEKGGLVLMADGSVKTMTAKEYKDAPKGTGK